MKKEYERFIERALEILDEMLEPCKENIMRNSPKHLSKSLALALFIKVPENLSRGKLSHILEKMTAI